MTQPRVVNTEWILKLWSREEPEHFHRLSVTAQCLDIEGTNAVRYTDEQARAIIKKACGCESVFEFQVLEITKRDAYLQKMREAGLLIRQISRLTGVSFNIVRNFKNKGIDVWHKKQMVCLSKWRN